MGQGFPKLDITFQSGVPRFATHVYVRSHVNKRVSSSVCTFIYLKPAHKDVTLVIAKKIWDKRMMQLEKWNIFVTIKE